MPIYDYSQPDTESPVINLADFLRIHQYSTSAGDIWESKVGANAFMIGSLSDFSAYRVVYFDAAIPTTFLNSISLTPDSPFIGTLQARNDKTGSYMPGNRPGRILLYPEQQFDKNYLPADYGVGSTILFEYPVVDLIQFFSAPSQIATSRADKTFFYQQVPFGAADAFLLVPCYGRRFMSCRFTNRTGGDMDITVDGIQWTLGDFSAGETATVTEIDTISALHDGDNDVVVIDTDVTGVFDYLQITYHPASAPSSSDIPTEIFVTDRR